MKRLMLAVLEDALRCLQTYTESRNPSHRKAFGEAETWILDRRLKGRSHLYRYARLWRSSPTICARAYVSGVCNCLTAEIPAACNGAPCAEASLQHRWSVGGRTVPNHHPATSQLTYALRAKRSIERWA